MNKDGVQTLHADIALFIGRVAAQSQSGQYEPISTTFQLLKILKGNLPNPLTLVGITSDDNSCGINLHVSQIVMLVTYKVQGEWTTSVCSQPQQDVTSARLFDFAMRTEQR